MSKASGNKTAKKASNKEKRSDKGYTMCDGRAVTLNRAIKDCVEYAISNYGMLPEEFNGILDKPTVDEYIDLLDARTPLPLRPLPPVAFEATVLTQEQEEEIALVAAGGDDAVEEELQAAVVQISLEYRQRNFTIANTRYNRDLDRRMAKETERKKLIEGFVAGERQAAINWALREWLTPHACQRVMQSPKYKSLANSKAEKDYSSLYQILKICRELFADPEEDPSLRIDNARKVLAEIVMLKPSGFLTFNEEFCDALEMYLAVGGVISDSSLVDMYVTALHDSVFSSTKKLYESKITRRLLPDAWEDFKKHISDEHERYLKGNTSSKIDEAVILDTTIKRSPDRKGAGSKESKPFKRDAKASGSPPSAKPDSSNSTGKSSYPQCPCCGRTHPGACHNIQAVEAYLTKCKESLATAKAARESKGEEKKSNLTIDLSIEPEAGLVKHFVPREEDIMSLLFTSEPQDEYDEVTDVMVTSVQAQRSSGDFYELIKDDGADFGIIAVTNPELGTRQRPTRLQLAGVVQGASAAPSAELDYKMDLGPALLYGNKNILCEYDLLKNYDKLEIGKHHQRWAHKTKDLSWNFYRNPRLYGDKKWHTFAKKRDFVEILSFYQPKLLTEAKPTASEIKLIDAAKHDHHRLGHPEDQVFGQLIDSTPGVTATHAGLKLWRSLDGPCEGCTQGKMHAHDQKPSTKPPTGEVGTAIAGDIMFTDKLPSALFVDIESQCPFIEDIKGRTLGDLKTAIAAAMVNWTLADHKPTALYYDRESALRHAEQWVKATYSLELHLLAAGQKEPHAEVNIRNIKAIARATKFGIASRHGYSFQWVRWLKADAVKVLQRLPKRGETVCPLEKFTGKPVDYVRDMRVELGEIILVERPKRGVATNLEPKAEWGIVVDRVMNCSGVIGVIIVSTRRLAYRLKFVRARVPDHILLAVRQLSGVSRFEADDDLDDMPDLDVAGRAAAQVEQPLGDVDQAPSSAPEVPSVSVVPSVPATASQDPVEEGEVDGVAAEEGATEEGALDNAVAGVSSEERDSPPSHGYNLRARKSALVAGRVEINQLLTTLYSGFDELGRPLEFWDDMLEILAAQITFKSALKSQKADAARDSMIVELKQALSMNTFKGAHLRDLSEEEIALILKATSLYKEKYLPTGEFEKSKSRVLVRGDMQKPEFTAASSSPTVRIETIFWFLAVAVYLKEKAIVFKIDFLSAYLNSPRPEEVKHKHVMLPKEIAAVLVEIDPSYKEYLLPDGRLLVEMLKLMYGYKEAGLAWYKLLTKMFISNGFQVTYWDQCLLTKYDGGVEIAVAISVDDCLFRVDSISTKMSVIKMCDEAFSGITFQDGDVLTHLGMVFDLSVVGEVAVSQDKFIADLCDQVPEAKPQETPMSPLYHDQADKDTSPPCDRERYRSLVMSAMFAATRSYPEARYTCCVLSSVVTTATMFHWRALLRLIGYFKFTRENHCLVIRPGSLNVVVSADASHHPQRLDPRSHTGGCVGVQGNGADIQDSYFCFVTHVQKITTKSAMECEVVAQDDLADWAVWSSGVRDALVPPSYLDGIVIKPAELLYNDKALTKDVYEYFDKIVMQGDNKSALIALEKGRGSFQKSKHILKRYFYITELIEAGRVVLKWVASAKLPADLLTKAVTVEVFRKLIYFILGKRTNPCANEKV